MNINKYYILVTEGITDGSLIEAILEKYFGFVQFQNVGDLPDLFREMIGIYPAATGTLQRQDSPTFFYKNTIGVAVKQAGGRSKIPVKISLLTELIDKLEVYDEFGGFLVFCDSDLNTAAEIRADFVKKFRKDEIVFENDYIKSGMHQLICKLYLFPENGAGAIEKLLLDCINVSNNNLYQDALEYRNKIMSDRYRELRSSCWVKNAAIQEFYADKVQFGAASAVLRPDKSVRFAIKDKLIIPEYFSGYMKLPEFRLLHTFLQDSLGVQAMGAKDQ